MRRVLVRNNLFKNARLTTSRHASSAAGMGSAKPVDQKSLTVLGIESSCDDSCVGIVRYPDGEILADERTSQFHVHNSYGGIVPILAVREHEVNLPRVLERALEKVQGRSIDLIAVTIGPGLKACLRTGMNCAMQLSKKLDIPVMGVNHLEAHSLVCKLERKDTQYPFMTLLVSGGHTCLSITEGPGKHKELGSTLDDAMGEAFDKVIRGLNDPEACSKHGGAVLEALALKGNVNPALRLPVALRGPTHKRPRSYDFSFSGLKSATSRTIAKNQFPVADIALEFQKAAVEHCVHVLRHALSNHPEIRQLVVCGGVASNTYLRERLHKIAGELGVSIIFPSPRLCVDNGVMVAWTGAERWVNAGSILGCMQSELLITEETQPRARWAISDL